MEKKTIGLLTTVLLLTLSCIPSFLLGSTPAPDELNANGVVQIVPAKDMFVSGLVWSPDSTKLAISYSRVGVESASLFQIYLLDVQSGKMNLLEESKQGVRDIIAWLPDDRIGFYAGGDLEEGTWLISSDGKGRRILVAKDVVAALSPDGQMFAYWKSESEQKLMSFISEITQSVLPVNNVNWDRREFASPNGLWLAVFHDPYEWHMGAYGWKMSVLPSKNQVPISNSDLDRLSQGKGFHIPIDYVPWSADSRILALCSWDSGLVLFDILLNVCRVQRLFPQIIQWSPSFGYLLVFSNGQFTVLDSTESRLSQIEWKTATHELPHSGWIKSQSIFFVIGRSSEKAKSRITFINAENGKIVSDELLEPEELVPYDKDKYKSISRSRYSLLLSDSSTRLIGSLLDTWNDVIYDQEKGMIFLSVYRPTGKVYNQDNDPVCQVEKKWVLVKLKI